ncbi:hypothetical protein ACXIZN_29395 [Amycolatopsis sp. TRM77291]
MRNRTRFFVGAAAALLLTAIPVSEVAAAPAVSYAEAVPGLAPSGATGGVYTDENGSALIGCTPETGVDNPHRSGTGFAVSGHGWWNKGNCTGETATVQTCLYEYYTDNTWRRKACGENSDLKPGGGSARRVPARRDCDTADMTSWRNHVDVDVNWEVDSGEVRNRQADVACRVTGPDQ